MSGEREWCCAGARHLGRHTLDCPELAKLKPETSMGDALMLEQATPRWCEGCGEMTNHG